MAIFLSDRSGDGRTSQPRTHENDHVGLGQLLRRAREDRGLTLAQIANETKIPQRHLEALEHDNLAALPDGFYRRAEIRAYARAVNLNQNLVLAALDRALKPPVARQAVSERPRTQPTPSPKRVLIVIGVVVVAAVFGRAMGVRVPALGGDAQVRSAIDSPEHSVAPGRETLPGDSDRTSQRTQLDQIAPPSAPSDGALAVGMNGDVAVATEQPQARESADSATELVVTTQPAGARVTVNGIGWGIAPLTIRHLPAGDKRIRVSKDGYATEERVVRLTEGSPRMVDIPLRSAP